MKNLNEIIKSKSKSKSGWSEIINPNPSKNYKSAGFVSKSKSMFIAAVEMARSKIFQARTAHSLQHSAP